MRISEGGNTVPPAKQTASGRREHGSGSIHLLFNGGSGFSCVCQ
jgi:hypothetical protein